MNLIALSLHFVFCSLFLVWVGTLSLHGLRLLLQPQWITPITPVLFKLLKLLYPLGLLFLIDLVFFHRIYPWVEEPQISGSFRALYLKESSFILRGIFYFGIWYWLKRQIEKRSPTPPPAGLLILVLLTSSFASFDWLMSLDPTWTSTIYGFEILLTGGLLAYNFSLAALTDSPPRNQLLDLNNFQLALIGLWSYLLVIQLVTVWSANLPAEAHYYLVRMHGADKVISILLALFQMILPILCLFFRRLKTSFRFTQLLARSTVVMQALYLFWLFRKDG